MKKASVLLLVVLAMLGCGKEKNKEIGGVPADKVSKEIILKKYSAAGIQQTEKQKAVEWIKNNNKWGTAKKPKGIVEVVEGYINGALEASAKKTPGNNIYIAINNKALKNGKDMIIIWKDNKFSVREMTDIEISQMKLPDNGMKTDKI
jgi:hypothetical protein